MNTEYPTPYPDIDVEKPDNYVSFRKDKIRGQKASAPATLFNSLREAAEIEDYRFFPED